MKLSMVERDELVAVAIKAVKTIDNQLTPQDLCKVFSRAYNYCLKLKKGNEDDKV